MGIALAGLAALAVAMGIGRFAFTPLLPMMQADAGLTLAGGGWLASANYAGYLAGALSTAAVRLPARIAILGSLAAITLTTAAMGLWSGFAAWAALRFAAGIASAWMVIHLSAWVLARFNQLGRPGLAGVVYAGVGTGIAAAGLVCLALMARGVASREAWLALGALSLAVTVLLWPAFDRADAVPARGEGNGWRRQWWALVLAYGTFGFGYIVPATFLPAMARLLVDDPSVFGWAWPAFGAAAALSTLAAGPLVKRFGNRRLWIGAQLAMALGVAAPVLLPGLAGILASALLVGGTFMVVTMAGLGEAQAAAGPHAARLMAALTAAFATGQIAGPVVVSLIVQAGGAFYAGLLLASFALAAGALALREPPTL